MTLLIPISYLNDACYISGNLDEKKLKPSVEEAQEDLKDLLGPEFYEEIESQYPSSMSAANSTLYEDYIKKWLAWQTYFYSLGFSQSDSTPTGEREYSDENSTILADVKLYSKEKNVRRRAVKFKQLLLNYLNNEQAKDATAFPLYKGKCREELSFAITSVGRGNKDAVISVNKAIIRNE